MKATPDSLRLSAQTALLGEVPPSMRFFQLWLENGALSVRVIFDATATAEHLECATSVIAEVLAGLPPEVSLDERVTIDERVDWRDGPNGSLVYLRHGELGAI